MELGDFFIVSRNSYNSKSKRVSFFQYAARHDLEIVVKSWKVKGMDNWMVILTIIGVNRWKIEAEQRHDVKGIRYSDGKWTARKREWTKTRAATKPKGKWVNQKTSDPIPAAASPSLSVDAPLHPVPTPTPSKPMVPVAMMTAEEIIALSLEMSRAEQGQTTV